MTDTNAFITTHRGKHSTRDKHRFAAMMRRNMTRREQAVWQRVRDRQLGISCVPQRVISGWVADFYFPAAKVVVEIDGSSHENQVAYDRLRDEVMQRHGLTVLRFTNEQVDADLDGVIESIRLALA